MMDTKTNYDTDIVPADMLSEVLQDLRITGVAYCRSVLTTPWGMRIPARPAASFHFVAAGTAWIGTVDGAWQELHAGDMVLLPNGTGHALADAPNRPAHMLPTLRPQADGERVRQFNDGGGGARTLLLCCHVRLDDALLPPLLALMPPALVLRAGACPDQTLPMLLGTMADEVSGQRIGAATVLARLADVVIARVIRAWVEHDCPETSGWVAAMRDPHLARALVAIHRDPGYPWSVESLAARAGASRSIFSERFTAIVGMSPGRYLTHWRMHLAQTWLRSERHTVADIAGRLGYESEAAFSRAFKRVVGRPPSTLRRLPAERPAA